MADFEWLLDPEMVWDTTQYRLRETTMTVKEFALRSGADHSSVLGEFSDYCYETKSDGPGVYTVSITSGTDPDRLMTIVQMRFA